MERRQCRPEPDRAGDPVENDIRWDIAHELLGLRRPERDVIDAELRSLRSQRLTLGARGEADYLEPIPVGADHVEGLYADRPGRTEDGHASHAAILPRAVAAGP